MNPQYLSKGCIAMDLAILISLLALLLSGSVAFGIYSRTEHGFFTLREVRRRIRRLGSRRQRQWEY